jgi:hypothetical protein
VLELVVAAGVVAVAATVALALDLRRGAAKLIVEIKQQSYISQSIKQAIKQSSTRSTKVQSKNRDNPGTNEGKMMVESDSIRNPPSMG